MTETIIAEYEERLRRAQLDSDVAELERLIDASLIFTALDGSVVRKEDDLAFHRDGTVKITRMDIVSREIACFDTTAVVNVVMDASARIGNNVHDDRIRYVRVWHRFADDWRVISGSMRVLETVRG